MEKQTIIPTTLTASQNFTRTMKFGLNLKVFSHVEFCAFLFFQALLIKKVEVTFNGLFSLVGIFVGKQKNYISRILIFANYVKMVSNIFGRKALSQ